MILHSCEEILETFSSTIQEALKERLLKKSTQIWAYSMCKKKRKVQISVRSTCSFLSIIVNAMNKIQNQYSA